MGNRRWTDEEVALLRDAYPSFGPSWPGWRNVLPGRSMRSIAKKATCLGLRSRSRWDEAQDRVVLAHVLAHVLAASRETGRSPDSVGRRVQTLMREARRRRGHGRREQE